MSEKNEEIIATQVDFSEEIIEIIKQYNKKELSLALSDYHDYDIAKVLPLIEKQLRVKVYNALTDEELSDIFTHLEDPSLFIEELSSEKLADIIEEMDSDDAVDILEELDEQTQQEVIQLLDEETQNAVELITAYDEEQIGSLMTNDFVSVKNTYTVKQAMRAVINQAGENDNISTIFVTDKQSKYCGGIRLRDLVIARSQTPLDDIIITSFPFIYANALVSDMLADIKDYAEPTLPVLSADNRLIGALTSADVVEVIDEELTEDYAQLAGLSEEALEDALERKNIFKGALKRLPWLIILLVLDLFIGAYVGVFEAVVIGVPFLVSFQQLVSGMSGNTGTQTLATTVKMLGDGESTFKEKAKFLFKEIRVGLLIGIVTGILSFVAVTLYSYLTHSTGAFITDLKAGSSVGVAMFLSASIASITGSVIPITLEKLGADPAVASGPLITTLNDFIAITVYYVAAAILLL